MEQTVLNLNSLLVKSQNYNNSPRALTGGNKSLALTREVKIRHTIIPQVRKRNQRFREVIQVPDSSREESSLVGVFTSIRVSERSMSADKVICRYPGFTYQIFVQQNKSMIISRFLKGLSFQLFKNASRISSFIYIYRERASVDLKTETNKTKMATVYRLVKEPKIIGSPMAENNRSEE